MQYKNIQIPNVHQKFYQKLFINFRDNQTNNLFLPFAKQKAIVLWWKRPNQNF